MATIGLKDIYFAIIESDDETGTVYDTPERMGGAMTANVQPAFNSADLRADDGVVATAESQGVTTVVVNTDDLSPEVEAKVLGREVNSDGVLIESEDDRAPYLALMFRAEKANGAYRYTVLYKGKFTPPEKNYETKQETPAFQTPTINGRFLRRDSDKRRGAQVDEDGKNVKTGVIDNWFKDVYEGPSETGGGGVEG